MLQSISVLLTVSLKLPQEERTRLKFARVLSISYTVFYGLLDKLIVLYVNKREGAKEELRETCSNSQIYLNNYTHLQVAKSEIILKSSSMHFSGQCFLLLEIFRFTYKLTYKLCF